MSHPGVVWDRQEFSRLLAGLYHGTASGDRHRAGAAPARLRRLFDSPVAVAAFTEPYAGARTTG
ncbi:Putative hydrolase [Streptomyces ambofaciens ATCC 23877]|uniref:Putative hydrolase n=1 Tax=Streptomyces ambofaciens (strain ATCC 23877 / 3486 / DSM 40053 / JCM 4204 / NBRC 12836 / NRRL B-2516) TaxID=278992 RepID=A0A0K2AN50_STRA7|nr:Putative hydrolase [Streptomyces ambofaciens ATCC 23877]